MVVRNLFYLLIPAFLFVNCSKDNNSNSIQSDLLNNTIWKFTGSGCDIYYKFSNGNFLMINPCGLPAISNLAFEKGTYNTTSNVLIINVKETCNSNKIGNTEEYNYTLSGNTLTISKSNESLIFNKVESLPPLNDNIEFGYWEPVIGGSGANWVKVSSCKLVY